MRFFNTNTCSNFTQLPHISSQIQNQHEQTFMNHQIYVRLKTARLLRPAMGGAKV